MASIYIWGNRIYTWGVCRLLAHNRPDTRKICWYREQRRNVTNGTKNNTHKIIKLEERTYSSCEWMAGMNEYHRPEPDKQTKGEYTTNTTTRKKENIFIFFQCKRHACHRWCDSRSLSALTMNFIDGSSENDYKLNLLKQWMVADMTLYLSKVTERQVPTFLQAS